MRLPVLLTLLVVLGGILAGCTDEPEPEAAHDAATGTTETPGDKTVPYEVNASADPSQLDGAHLHDEWGQAMFLQLADLSVSTQSCGEGNPFMDLFLLGAGIFREQEVQKGCAMFAFDDGKIVPEGTARLHIEIDATDALQQGGMQLGYGNEKVRFTELDETTEKTFSWTIEMEPVEWDLPHSTETEWFFLLRPAGQIAVLDGTVDVVVMAERVENWTPILGSAHIDHWDMETQKDAHAFITPDVIRSLDTNVTVEYPSFADRIGDWDGQDPVPLDDIIPPETMQVSLAVRWDPVQNCPAGHGCWVVAFLGATSGGGRGWFLEPVATGADWAVYVYDVPEPMAPDSTYATESVYTVRAFVRACPNGEPLETPLPFFNGCLGEAVATMTAETRFEVESWKTPVDLDALKTRLGFQ